MKDSNEELKVAKEEHTKGSDTMRKNRLVYHNLRASSAIASNKGRKKSM